MQHVNQGSVTAFVVMTAGLIAGLFPRLSPHSEEIKANATALVAVVFGAWGLIDELIHSTSNPTIG